jgi:hypothetical protein
LDWYRVRFGTQRRLITFCLNESGGCFFLSEET